MIDVMEIRKAIKQGELKTEIVRNNIILKDIKSGEAVKVGELNGGSDD